MNTQFREHNRNLFNDFGTMATKPIEFWEAMAWWLAKEKRRHLDDVKRIDRDLERLRKMGIEIPELEEDIWIEVPDDQYPHQNS